MKKNNRNNANRTVIADISINDQKRFWQFFKQELGFYNHVIGIFESRVRAFPEKIESLTKEQINFFADCAKHNFNVTTLDKDRLPKALAKHEAVCFDKQGNRLVTGMFSMMCSELIKQHWVVDPGTKFRIAQSVANFFRDQAEILSKPNKSENLDMAYRVPPANLHKLEIEIKRHVQLPRKSVTYRYINETHTTEIQTPYNVDPIVIPEFNIHDVNGWNTVIVKQESGKNVDHHTPWLVELKDTGDQYLLRYIDIGRQNRR